MDLTQRRRFFVIAAISLTATFVVGIAHLNFPFMGDQALFSVYGRMLEDGAVLYEDVWDVKQPGIFAFYWIAGRLFGFSEVGAHLLELIYLFTFGTVLMLLARFRYRSPWIAGLIPFTVVGWYYAVAQLDYLAQVESLAGPLLFTATWLLWKGGKLRSVCAGVLGGLVLYLKLALAPLLVALWLVALHQSGGIRHRSASSLLPAVAGLAIAAVPIAVYVAGNGLVDRVWWTFVTYPPQVVAIAGRTPDRLMRAVGQFGLLFLPLFLLAARGLWVRKSDPFTRIGAVWLVVGFATYLLQLWWGYVLLIILVPLALIALDGLDDLVVMRRRHFRFHVAVLLLAAIPAAITLGMKTVDLGQNGFGVGDRQLDYQAAVSDDYAQIRDDIVHLAKSDPAPIYVLGDPLYLYLSERPQAPANTGWSPKFWTEALWDELGTGLVADQPVLLLVDGFSADVAQERSPETLEIINSEYEVLRPSFRNGTWYVHRSAISPSR